MKFCFREKRFLSSFGFREGLIGDLILSVYGHKVVQSSTSPVSFRSSGYRRLGGSVTSDAVEAHSELGEELREVRLKLSRSSVVGRGDGESKRRHRKLTGEGRLRGMTTLTSKRLAWLIGMEVECGFPFDCGKIWGDWVRSSPLEMTSKRENEYKIGLIFLCSRAFLGEEEVERLDDSKGGEERIQKMKMISRSRKCGVCTGVLIMEVVDALRVELNHEFRGACTIAFTGYGKKRRKTVHLMKVSKTSTVVDEWKTNLSEPGLLCISCGSRGSEMSDHLGDCKRRNQVLGRSQK